MSENFDPFAVPMGVTVSGAGEAATPTGDVEYAVGSKSTADITAGDVHDSGASPEESVDATDFPVHSRGDVKSGKANLRITPGAGEQMTESEAREFTRMQAETGANINKDVATRFQEFAGNTSTEDRGDESFDEMRVSPEEIGGTQGTWGQDSPNETRNVDEPDGSQDSTKTKVKKKVQTITSPGGGGSGGPSNDEGFLEGLPVTEILVGVSALISIAVFASSRKDSNGNGK